MCQQDSAAGSVGGDALAERVKEAQRQSGAARLAWKNYCDSEGAGVRDPLRHSAGFLQGFLDAYSSGRLASDVTAAPSVELVEVSSSERSLGCAQLRLRMPASEAGIMKEVVSTNAYGFLPGRSCVLRAGDIVLDIGAHVGIAAALALRTRDVCVVCVEPHPLTFEVLRGNMAEHGDRVVLDNRAVAEEAGARPLYVHSGTNAPSRLYFSSLFDTRSHEDETIAIECVTLEDLVNTHDPSVIKLDAEGAERFLAGVRDFRGVRVVAAEWDWTHNRRESAWQRVAAHLGEQGFDIEIKGQLPAFDAAGDAVLCSRGGKKRGSTGMIFVATRRHAFLEVRPSS